MSGLNILEILHLHGRLAITNTTSLHPLAQPSSEVNAWSFRNSDVDLTSSSSSVQSERKGTNSSRDLSSPRATAIVDSLLTLFSLSAISSFFNSSLQGQQYDFGLCPFRLVKIGTVCLGQPYSHQDCNWIQPALIRARHYSRVVAAGRCGPTLLMECPLHRNPGVA